MTDTFVARMSRGAGRFAPDRMLYFGEMAMADLEGVDLMVLVETTTPVAFFAYPDRPSVLVPEGCEEASLCGRDADGPAALHALADALAPREAEFQAELAALKARATAAYAAGLGPYESFPATLRAVMPRDALWVRDITISNSSWGNRILHVLGARDAVHPVGAAIGPGLPLGIGAALGGGGRKAIAMVGDGGFAVNMPELFTAVQEQAELIIMVMNDAGYGVIRHIQDFAAGRRFYHDLRGPDLMDLAKLAGLPGMRVSTVEDFGPTLARAFATPGPVLVEIDMVSIGEHPPYAPYDKARPTG